MPGERKNPVLDKLQQAADRVRHRPRNDVGAQQRIEQQSPAQRQQAERQMLLAIGKNIANGGDPAQYRLDLSDQRDIDNLRAFLNAPGSTRDMLIAAKAGDRPISIRERMLLSMINSGEQNKIYNGLDIFAKLTPEQRAIFNSARQHDTDRAIEIMQSPELIRSEVTQRITELAQRSAIRVSEPIGDTATLRAVMELSPELRAKLVAASTGEGDFPSRDLKRAGVTDPRDITMVQAGAHQIAEMSPDQRALLENIRGQHTAQETIAIMQSPELIRRELLSIDATQQADDFLNSLTETQRDAVFAALKTTPRDQVQAVLETVASLPTEQRTEVLREAAQLSQMTTDQEAQFTNNLTALLGTTEQRWDEQPASLEQFARTRYLERMRDETPEQYNAPRRQELRADNTVSDVGVLNTIAATLERTQE